jgi:hydroxylamine reductase
MNMFCFQCEQTAGGRGCQNRAGVYGKPQDVALLQDKLTGALITNAANIPAELIIGALFATVTNVNFGGRDINALIEKIGGDEPFDMHRIWAAQEDIRSLKSLILFGIRGMAAYAHHALALGYADGEVM